MDILTTIVYVVLFIIITAFIFSIGMLRPFMPKKEIALVLVSAFIMGCLGGAFFLTPLYNEMPEVVSTLEKVIPSNEEVMYLDVSSASDMDDLTQNLTNTDGVKSVEVTGITFQMWRFNDREYEYMNSVVGNLDANYTNYTVNQSGRIDINISEGYDVSDALRSFSDWYKLVYGGTISYAQIHMKVTLASSSLDQVEANLLERGIVATNIEGPVQDSVVDVNNSMLSNNEFVFCTGVFGVFVSILGIYCDTLIVSIRKFRKFVNKKTKR